MKMNNALRFRVLDKVFNEYWSDEQIKENAGWLLFPNNSNINDIKIEKGSDEKDINGRFIFEGDILRLSIDGHIQDKLFVVKDLRSLLFLIDREDPCYAIDWVEIVGNIHENEELLR